MSRFNMLKPAAAVTAFAVCAAGLSGCGSFLNSFKYLFTPEPTRSVSSQSQSGSAPAVRGQTRTGYGYDSLGSDELKTIYNTIDEQMSCSYSEEFTVYGSLSDFDEALGAYEADHPEAFWLDLGSRYSYIDYGDSVSVELNFEMEGDQLSEAKQAFDDKVDQIAALAPQNADEYHTEIFINDYLIDNCDYQSGASMSHNAYGSLINGAAVCDGYSKAFQVLCDKLGIQCVGINGYSPDFNKENGESSDTGHMWNCVNIGGEWYHIDVTWNDGDTHIQRYLYFNMTTEDIRKNHTISPLYSNGSDPNELYNVYVPECTAEDYNYMKRECVTLYSLDESDELIAAFLEAARNREEYVDFLISEDLDYGEATQAISDSYGYRWIEEVNYYNSDGAQISTDSNFYTYGSINAVTFDLQYTD